MKNNMIKLILNIIAFIQLLIIIDCADLKKAPLYKFPVVNFADLITLDESTVSFISNSLVTVGVLQIQGIPNFKASRIEALQPLAQCLKNDNDAYSKIMSDGSSRKSAQAVTKHGQSGDMSSKCGSDSAKLRASIDMATRQLFLSLDSAVKLNEKQDNEDIMIPYKTFDNLIRNGDHLEHLHSYYGGITSETASTPTLDFHTDNGLLIAMTSGLYSNEGENQSNSGLYLKLPTGITVQADVYDDSLIIMVGQGGANWLVPVLGAPLHAVEHALIADLTQDNDVTRSWYGKMFLPPSNAILNKLDITFSTYNANIIETLNQPFLPAGSGMNFGRKLTSSLGCAYGEIECWSQCMSSVDLLCGSNFTTYDASNIVCYDSGSSTVPAGPCDGGQMCPSSGMTSPGNCALTCKTDWDYVPPYCTGPGISMNMEGFDSITSNDPPSPCINLFFQSWTLNNATSYFFGCVLVLFISILIQYLTHLRFITNKRPLTHKRNAIVITLYFIQVFLSYLIMLAAMTYSIELFLMVILGLTIGHVIFNMSLPPSQSTDPCCVEESDYDVEELKKSILSPISSSKLI